MHLLATQPGSVDDGSAAIDLGQSPGDIIFVSAADTELSCLAAAQGQLVTKNKTPPTLRLANLLRLSHNMSVDLYVEQMIPRAKLVIGRLLGGRSYWPYGVDEITTACKAHHISLAWLPGDDTVDPILSELSTVAPLAQNRLWNYLRHGGLQNAEQFLNYAAHLTGRKVEYIEPALLPRTGIYTPNQTKAVIPSSFKNDANNKPIAVVVFYRALLQAGNLSAIDALLAALTQRGFYAAGLYAVSLKNKDEASAVQNYLAALQPDIILNTLGFSLSNPAADPAARLSETPFDLSTAPQIQTILSSMTEDSWRDSAKGLSSRDLAMSIALPEVDGKLIGRAISFKTPLQRDPLTEIDLTVPLPAEDRLNFTADLATAWARLRRTPVDQKRVALILANYPNRDGRMANGVGLDTPASTVTVLTALQKAGYHVVSMPPTSAALIQRLSEGPTNASVGGRNITERFSFSDYRSFFKSLPQAIQSAVMDRWGEPETDPFATQDGFAIPGFRCGNIAILLQPARGYNIDPDKTYHDPDLVPPHGYLAAYAWVRAATGFSAHAVVHLGKHGNLEWLPGKSVALSENCFPEAILGPLPNLYPFIVNDPGEGTQAKRRAVACIIDHLTPPLTRAETYGPLRQLESLVDEYYEAAALDPKRRKILAQQILDRSSQIGLDRDIGVNRAASDDDRLSRIDAYLCELKEMQIRDGLHVFGQSPKERLEIDLLAALSRGSAFSLQHAISQDLFLNLDPRAGDLGTEWRGPKPEVLANLMPSPWRTTGDTVERIEALVAELVAGKATPSPAWMKTIQALQYITDQLRPAVQRCGEAEINGLLTGLAGQFVAPGPSGAPTRGRPEVLPTGRNFYGVDLRALPTPAAWTIGWKAAHALLERHVQDHGVYPRRLAMSAWGTANIRTGGDDVAQALALMGVRPQWDDASRRVVGFEILPLSVLDRPRVDVLFRISGFFRDAFPNLIDLLDSAARAVAALDEPEKMNPLAAAVKEETARLTITGVKDAALKAGFRVFGSKPGSYGAGLQALIDEKGWTDDGDFAAAYLAWGSYAYGKGAEGDASPSLFADRLAASDAVLHNQDNREHDLLDSDDYYQFQGGLAATIRHLSGQAVPVYHGDSSNPEAPRVRRLEEEIARVVRGRVVNPKWIAGAMRHGYKGAFEMAATVDYMFAFAATAHAVADHHFDAVYEAYLGDDTVRDFIAAHNPAALTEMALRLLEAQDRHLWRPRSNSARHHLESLVSSSGRR